MVYNLYNLKKKSAIRGPNFCISSGKKILFMPFSHCSPDYGVNAIADPRERELLVVMADRLFRLPRCGKHHNLTKHSFLLDTLWRASHFWQRQVSQPQRFLAVTL